jgi:hypothetical protein
MTHDKVHRSPQEFNKEVERYKKLIAVGLSKELESLDQHIHNLEAAAPVDDAGFITAESRDYIEALKDAYLMALSAQALAHLANASHSGTLTDRLANQIN